MLLAKMLILIFKLLHLLLQIQDFLSVLFFDLHERQIFFNLLLVLSLRCCTTFLNVDNAFEETALVHVVLHDAAAVL